MKRPLAILLLLVYLVSSIGVFASVHYCGDRVAHISLLDTDEGFSCGCQAMTGHDCCSDVVVKASQEKEGFTSPVLRVAFKSAFSLTLFSCFPSTCLPKAQTDAGRSFYHLRSGQKVPMGLTLVNTAILRF